MRKYIALIVTIGVVALAAPAQAQVDRRVPDTGMVGVGFNIAAAIPTDGSIRTGPQLGVNLETYLTPRVSIRGMFSGAWLDANRPFDADVQPMNLLGNLVYNWEGGKWHPFVTGGVGYHRFRFEDSGLKGTANKFGVHFGGGTEFFFTRRDTLTGEVRYHMLPGEVTSPLSVYEPSFWSIAGGYKKYF